MQASSGSDKVFFMKLHTFLRVVATSEPAGFPSCEPLVLYTQKLPSSQLSYGVCCVEICLYDFNLQTKSSLTFAGVLSVYCVLMSPLSMQIRPIVLKD